MARELERRQQWRRIIGVERRGAPFSTVMGRPLPDPTRLEDEEFQAAPADGRREQPWRPSRTQRHPRGRRG